VSTTYENGIIYADRLGCGCTERWSPYGECEGVTTYMYTLIAECAEHNENLRKMQIALGIVSEPVVLKEVSNVGAC
jgi:hypothetical protein